MEGYEKNIGLKTIWLTIIRRFEYILFIFIPIALTTLIVTSFVLTKTYQSSVTVSTANDFTTNFQLLQIYFSDNNILNSTIESLRSEKNIEITVSEITTGLSFTAPTVTNKFSGKVSYQSTKSNYVQPVLDMLSNKVVEYAKEKDNSKFGTLTISSAASVARKNSSENKYLLIGLVAGLVVAFAIPFIDEIISDEVYDSKGIQQLGCEAFELNVSKLNKKMVDGEKYGSYKI